MLLAATRCYLIQMPTTGIDLHEWLFLLVTG
jgi:hypothetical protein